jgi:hypothetical protein
VALGQSGGISLKRRSLEKHLRTSP